MVSGNLVAVKALLAKGVDLSIEKPDGSTAASLADAYKEKATTEKTEVVIEIKDAIQTAKEAQSIGARMRTALGMRPSQKSGQKPNPAAQQRGSHLAF